MENQFDHVPGDLDAALFESTVTIDKFDVLSWDAIGLTDTVILQGGIEENEEDYFIRAYGNLTIRRTGTYTTIKDGQKTIENVFDKQSVSLNRSQLCRLRDSITSLLDDLAQSEQELKRENRKRERQLDAAANGAD